MNNSFKDKLYQSMNILGFTKNPSDQMWSLDLNKLHEYGRDKLSKGKIKQESYLNSASFIKINKWLIEEKSNFNHLISLSFDLKTISIQLNESIDEALGESTRRELVFGDSGEIWCLFEFSKPSSRMEREEQLNFYKENIQVGLAGFSIRLNYVGNKIKILISDHFSIGFAPSGFISAPINIIKKTFKTSSIKIVSLFELELTLEDLAYSFLQRFLDTPYDENLKVFDEIKNSSNNLLISSAILFKDNSWNLSNDAMANFSKMKKQKTPIEVLESREFSKKYKYLDKLIIQGMYNIAKRECEVALNDDHNSCFLLRRLALLKIANLNYSHIHKTEELQKKEPKNKLLLSHQIRINIEKGNDTSALNDLSKLGEELIKSGLKIDQIRIFEVVFPELLGDLWLSENKSTSISCYERIIQKQGSIPRVLRKLIQIYRIENDIKKEISLLNKLINVETRSREIAKIYKRQSEITINHQQDAYKAVDLAIKSLQHDKGQFEAALILADALCELDRVDEAIETLTELTQVKDKPISDKIKAIYECKIGKIWKNILYREDLAKQRFENALSFDKNCIEAKNELDTSSKNEDLSGQIQLLENEFLDTKISFTDEDNWENFEILFNYYNSNKIVNKKKHLITQAISEIDLISGDIERLAHYDCEGTSWNPLIKRLKTKLKSEDSQLTKAQMLSNIGIIYIQKIHNKEEGIKNFELAMENGFLHKVHVNYVVDYYKNRKEHAKVCDIIFWQIEHSEDSEHLDYYIKLYNFSEYLSLERQEKVLINLYKIESNYKEDIESHIYNLGQNNKYIEMKNFIETVVNIKNNDLYKYNWLLFWNENIKESRWDQKNVQLDTNFQKLLEISHDPIEVLNDAISYFDRINETKYISKYTLDSLNRNISPIFNENRLLEIIDSNHVIFEKYINCKIDNPKDVNHFLVNLCKTKLLNFEILKKIETLNFEIDWKTLLEIFHLQSLFDRPKNEKLFLLNNSLQLLERESQDDQRKIQTLQEILDLEPNENLQMKLFSYSLDNSDQENMHKGISEKIEYFIDQSNFTSLTKLLNLLKTKSKNVLKTSINKLSESWIRKSDFNSLLLLNRYYYEAGVKDPMSSLAFSIDTIEKEEFNATYRTFLNGLQNLNSCLATIAYLNLFFEKSQVIRDFKLKHFTQKVKDSSSDDFFSINTWKISLLFIANFLCDSLNDQKEAFEIYSKLFIVDKEDHNIWLPLYFLSREINNDENHTHLLNEIIPRIEMHPHVLQKTPITIESLKNEFEKHSNEDLVFHHENSISEDSEKSHKDLQMALSTIEDLSSQDKWLVILNSQPNAIEISAKITDSQKAADSVDLLSVFAQNNQENFYAESTSQSQYKLAVGGETGFNGISDIEENSPFIPDIPEDQLLRDEFVEKTKEVKKILLDSDSNNITIEKVMNSDFLSDLQKHIAMQIIAIRSSDMKQLNNWKWTPWISNKLTEYPHWDSIENEKLNITKFKSPLLKLVLASTPLFVKLNKDLFTLSGLGKRLNLSAEEIGSKISKLNWDDPALKNSNISKHKEVINKRKFKLYNFKGLEQELFYDGIQRVILIDIEHYKGLDHNILSHRILHLIYSIELNFFPLLKIDFDGFIHPTLKKINNILIDKSSQIEDNNNFNHKLLKSSPERIEKHLKLVGVPEQSHLQSVKDDISSRINKRMFLETLDLISFATCSENKSSNNNEIDDLIEFAIKIATE